MQPSITQSFPESDKISSDAFCSQDSFNPISQSGCILGRTQDEMLSSVDSGQFCSFKPKRNVSKVESALRNPKKKVRFADDQNTPPLHVEDDTGEFEEMQQFDLNATCPVDFGTLYPDTSFDATPTLPRAHSSQQPNISPGMNGIVFRDNPPNANTYSDFVPSKSVSSEGRPNTASNPNYTYVFREMVVKKRDNIVSVHQSVRMCDDVTPTVVLEQSEQVHNVRNGDFSFAQRRAFNGLGAQHTNTRVSDNFPRKNVSGLNFNSFDYGTPAYANNPIQPGSTFQSSHHGNQMQSQEFDAPNYQSSQQSEFGNPFSDSFGSENLLSSQHSFTPTHDDEFVPNEFSESRISSFNFENLESISTSTVSSQSNRSFSSQTPNLGDKHDTASLSPVSLEFTPIISKLERQLSLESYDQSTNPRRARVSDLHYL